MNFVCLKFKKIWKERNLGMCLNSLRQVLLTNVFLFPCWNVEMFEMFEMWGWVSHKPLNSHACQCQLPIANCRIPMPEKKGAVFLGPCVCHFHMKRHQKSSFLCLKNGIHLLCLMMQNIIPTVKYCIVFVYKAGIMEFFHEGRAQI